MPRPSAIDPQTGEELSAIARLAGLLLTALRRLSLSNARHLWPEGSYGRKIFMDFYVAAWLAALVAILILVPPGNVLAIAAAAYEAADVTIYRLYFLLEKSRAKKWQPARIRRTLGLAALNFLELVVAFAVIYRQSGTIVHSCSTAVLDTAASAFYFSLVTITTLGYGDFVPATDPARMLVATELLSGLVMLVFLLPALISILSEEFREKRNGPL